MRPVFNSADPIALVPHRSSDREKKMPKASFWATAAIAVLALTGGPTAAFTAEPADCPNGGTVRFGVEPYDTAARLVPIYQKVADMLGEKLGFSPRDHAIETAAS